MEAKELNIEKVWKSQIAIDPLSGRLTKELIENFRNKKPGGIFRSVSFTFKSNFLLKLVFLLAQLCLLVLYIGHTESHLPIITIFVITSVLCIPDIKMLRSLNKLQYSGQSVKKNLENLLLFFKTEFSVYRLYGALLNPILILTGIFFYDYFKYGKPHFISDGESVIVLSAFLIFGYLIGYFASYFSFRQIEQDINDYLRDLEEPQNVEEIIKTVKKRKKRNLIIGLSILLLGLLLLVSIILIKVF